MVILCQLIQFLKQYLIFIFILLRVRDDLPPEVLHLSPSNSLFTSTPGRRPPLQFSRVPDPEPVGVHHALWAPPTTFLPSHMTNPSPFKLRDFTHSTIHSCSSPYFFIPDVIYQINSQHGAFYSSLCCSKSVGTISQYWEDTVTKNSSLTVKWYFLVFCSFKCFTNCSASQNS